MWKAGAGRARQEREPEGDTLGAARARRGKLAAQALVAPPGLSG